MRAFPRALSTGLLTVVAISLVGCAAAPGSANPSATAALAVTTPAPSALPSTGPSASPPPVESPASSAALIDTDTWVSYTSDRYGFTVRHPADWQPEPADHAWTIDEAPDAGSTGHERFRHPDDDVGVSMWAYDPGSDVSLETTEEIVAWVEDFCRIAVEITCYELADRAVPLCFGSRDCNPAVLVPFTHDTYAFIPGFTEDGMIIAAVWRPEHHASTQPYGGARKLLEGYLSTINANGTTGVFASPAP